MLQRQAPLIETRSRELRSISNGTPLPCRRRAGRPRDGLHGGSASTCRSNVKNEQASEGVNLTSLSVKAEDVVNVRLALMALLPKIASLVLAFAPGLVQAARRQYPLDLRASLYGRAVVSRRPLTMPRYYFHLTNGEQVLDNHQGLDLPGDAAARDDALALARDLKHGDVMQGWDWDGWFINIVNEQGHKVDELPIADA
jgi:hypothetical protein